MTAQSPGVIPTGSSCVPIGDGAGWMCGTPVARIRRTGKCLLGICKTETSRLIDALSSSPYYGPITYCECGDRWDASEGWHYERPFRRGWRAEAQRRFERMWLEAFPEGTREVRDEDFYLIGVRPPEGWTPGGGDR